MIDKETNEILKSFESAVKAAKYVNGFGANIISCAQGKKLTMYGYNWVFAELWDSDENYRKKMIQRQNAGLPKIPVVQVKISNMKAIREFNSIKHAAQELGIRIRSTNIREKGFHLVSTGEYAIIDKRKWEENQKHLIELIRSYETINYNDAKRIMNEGFGNQYGYIYKATNIKNGKMYIGQTTKELKERVKRHFRDAIMTPSSIFHYALRKYGSKGFEWEIIDFDDSQDELNKKEIEWINKFDSTNINIGYNSTFGGEGGKPTQELKQKMSNIIKDIKGQKVYKLDKETYQVLKTFNSIADAAHDVSVSPGSISNCLFGSKFSVKGYKWVLAESWDNDTEYQNLIKARKNKNEFKVNAKTIYKLNVKTFEVISKFKSLADAARDVDASHISIGACANGQVLEIKGYKWVFAEEWDNDSKYRELIKSKKSKSILGIYQLDKMSFEVVRKYERLVDAAIAFGVTKASLSGCVHGKTATCAGYRWVDANLWDNDDEYRRKIKDVSYKRGAKTILQIDKNSNSIVAEFASISKVAELLRVHKSHIKVALFDNEKTAVGYKWRYKELILNNLKKPLLTSVRIK